MPALPDDVVRRLAEAAEWRLLGLLFEYPNEAWRRQLESLRPALTPDLVPLADAALEHATEGMHFALFGPAGSVPVREVTWQGGLQLGYLMAELSTFYEAFDYHPSTPEAPDHLAVQAGFMSFLRMKEAQALLTLEPDQAQVAADAAAEFLKEHLAAQAEPVLRALENVAPDFLVEAGRRIFAQAGPAPRSSYPLVANSFDRDEEGCGPAPGAAEELVQLQHD